MLPTKIRTSIALMFSTALIILIIFLCCDCLKAQYLPVQNVNTGIYFSSIQEAINHELTRNGHTILVSAGIYMENIVINKSILLISTSKHLAIIDGQHKGTVVRIESENCTVEGFMIRNSGKGFSGIQVLSSKNRITNNVLTDNYNGIYMMNCKENIILSNEIERGEYAIRLYNASENLILENSVKQANIHGISIESSFGNKIYNNSITKNGANGIFIRNSKKNEFQGNNILSNLGAGIRLLNSSGNVFTENLIYNNTYAVDMHFSQGNTLVNNTIVLGGHGVLLYNSSFNTLISNNITLNKEGGIYILSSGNCTVNGNILSKNQYGILLEMSDKVMLRFNVLMNNIEFGISLENSSFNMIYHNNFIDNGVNVKQPSNGSIANFWDNGLEGNFWSDYRGFDRDGDGIGDVPYYVDERRWLGYHSRDNYPLMGKIQQYDVAFNNRSYTLYVISNLAVSALDYVPPTQNESSAIKIQLEESAGFVRIAIPHSLVSPPFEVIANNATLAFRMILTKQNYTWLYLVLAEGEEIIIMQAPEEKLPQPPPPSLPVWQTWWMWIITALIIAFLIQFFISLRLRSTIRKLSKLIEEYSPFRVAQRLFSEDVERRKSKIRNFESKYGIKIRPRESLNEILEKLIERRENERRGNG